LHTQQSSGPHGGALKTGDHVSKRPFSGGVVGRVVVVGFRVYAVKQQISANKVDNAGVALGSQVAKFINELFDSS
jgi:hypothetical protein